MTIPKLKRIKISSVQELHSWLARSSGQDREIMIVTCNRTSRDKYISTHQVSEVLEEFGWDKGRSYTLSGNLVGHVGRQRAPGPHEAVAPAPR